MRLTFLTPALLITALGASFAHAQEQDHSMQVGMRMGPTITLRYRKTPPESSFTPVVELDSEVLVEGVGPNFLVVYQDVEQDTGAGFDDPDVGAIRRQTLEDLLVDISAMLPTFQGTTRLGVQLSLDDLDSNMLASGGPSFFCTGGFVDVIPLLAISENPIFAPAINLDMDHASLTVNFAAPFENDGNAPVGFNEFDFRSVLFHEITHTFGFGSALDSDSDDPTTADICADIEMPPEGQTFLRADSLLVNGAGEPIFQEIPNENNFFNVAGEATGAQVFDLSYQLEGFPLADTFADPGTVAHFDESLQFNNQPLLMAPAIAPGPGAKRIRTSGNCFSYLSLDSSLLTDPTINPARLRRIVVRLQLRWIGL